MRHGAQAVRLSGRGVIAGLTLVAGLVMSAGPLLGAMVAAVRVVQQYSEASRRGVVLSADAVGFPYRPIAIGFAVFLPGILLLARSVLGYSRRVMLLRSDGRD